MEGWITSTRSETRVTELATSMQCPPKNGRSPCLPKKGVERNGGSCRKMIHGYTWGYMAMDQYLYIPFLGDEHPFTSYFDVHQGDRVLTHPHIVYTPKQDGNIYHPAWFDSISKDDPPTAASTSWPSC